MKISRILFFLILITSFFAQEEKKEIEVKITPVLSKEELSTSSTKEKIEEVDSKEKKKTSSQQIIMEELEIVGKIEKPQAMYIIPKAKSIALDIILEESFWNKFNMPFEIVIIE